MRDVTGDSPRDAASAGGGSGRDSTNGLTWTFESPERHWSDHDARQGAYWRSRPAAERLAQAAEYRRRRHGAVTGPVTWTWRFLALDDA
jgi:hypothetical protein